jgi:hypothetical protein
MTLVYAESFDWQGTHTDRPGYTGSANWQPGRINGRAFYVQGGGEFQYTCGCVFPAAYSQGCFALSFRVTVQGTGSNRFVLLRNSLTTHLAIYLNNATMSLSVARDGTVLGTTASNVIFPSAWHRIELGFVIHDTTGSVELRVDGAVVLTLTNVDTRNGATTDVNTFILGNAGTSNDTYIDDVTLCDSPTQFLGDLHIEQLVPTSNAAVTWTPSTGANYATVDEARVSTTDYVTAPTAGLIDRYGMADMAASPTTVFAVQTLHHANKDDTGTCTMRANVISGASTGNGATRGMNSTPFIYADIFTTDPQGGAAWTGARVNAMQLEIERVS